MKALIAVDLGSRNIHLAAGIYQKGMLKVTAAHSHPLPEDLIRGDRIQSVDIVAENLADTLRESGIAGKSAVITVNAIGGLTKDLHMPAGSKAKDLNAMISNELRLSCNVSDAFTTQYKAIKKSSDETSAQLTSYRTVSISDAFVENCHDILLRAKLKPLAMDVNINAVDKLLSQTAQINDKPLNEGAAMFLDFGHHRTTAYIHTENKPLFFRHLSVGSGEIERILSDETLNPLEEIRQKKEGLMDLFSEEEEARRYYQILRAYFYSFNDELSNIIKFYNYRYKDTHVEKIYLFGGGSRLSGLSAYWESALSLPVETIKSISSVQIPADCEDPMPYVNCFGALIRN